MFGGDCRGTGGEREGESGTYVPERKRKTMLWVECSVSCIEPCVVLRRGCLHQRVRKAHFGTVDGTIAGCFDESEIFGVLRV